MREKLTWRARFLETTRGRVLALLRREPRTVSEIAELLEVTEGAVRSHLGALERDGLAERRAVRRSGVGKPPGVFAATPQAEELFPKAYEAVLSALLTELEDELDSPAVERLLRRVGRRTAAARGAGNGETDPLSAALEAVEELGGEPRVGEDEEGVWIEGSTCPLSGVVPDHPRICLLLEALLEEILGTAVRERCRRKGVRARCTFLVPADGAGA